MDQALRGIVRSRGGDRCEYCLLPTAAVFLPFHIEHIMARQHGGGDDIDNLAWACDRCNWLKGPNLSSIDPRTGKITRLFHPRRDEWGTSILLWSEPKSSAVRMSAEQPCRSCK